MTRFEAIRIDKDDAGYRAGYQTIEGADSCPAMSTSP